MGDMADTVYDDKTPLMEVMNVSKIYGKKGLFTKTGGNTSAVSNVSLRIRQGVSLGLIGESGSGKSTLGRMLAGLEKPTAGQILYRGREISSLSLREMRPYRRNIQMIFQNSGGVFDPAYTIGYSIGELVRNNKRLGIQADTARVGEVLEQVGLSSSFLERKSRELSGGQQQRANIARALVLNPEFVVCDEPVSSLDYSLRKQILSLLNDIRRRFGFTYLFITHDLRCVPYVCDSVAIMYAGRILEQFSLDTHSMDDAVHPYTHLLLRSIPVRDPSERTKRGEFNEAEDFVLMPGSRQCCRFYPRCKRRIVRCEGEAPPLVNIGSGHAAACHCL
jgi:peptide/nickel transport system ATP-binding protein